MAKLLGGTRIYGNATVDTFLSVAGNIVAGNIIVDVISANNYSGLTTTTVQEGLNLYFTNARVHANVIETLVNYATVSNLNLKANVTDLTTSNVVEGTNLYYTNARVYSNVISLINVKANVADLTTTNVIEGTQLYYTNARVYSNVIGLINVKANVTDLTTANVAETASGLYYTNARVYSNVEPLLAVKANIADLTTSNVAEGTQLYFTNARSRSAISSGTGVSYDSSTGVIAIGQNVSPNATVTFSNLNVTGTVNFYGNVTTHSSNNLSISDNMIYLNNGSQSSNPDLGMAFNYNDGSYHHAGFFRDASDGVFKVFDNYAPEPDSNIFIDTDHATFRLANIAATTFYGNLVGTVSSLGNFTTTSINEGTNLYYTNTRVYSNVAPLLALKANVVDLTTANVVETASGLYYTNARVYSNVIGLINAKANVVDLTTANVVETASGLYYTNARVYSNVIGLISAKANVVDLTTSNVAEGTQLYYTNARVYSNVISALPTYTGNINAGNVIGNSVISNGDVISAERLVSNYSVGDEGGEIKLAKPATNSTLANAGVTIDIYQNKIRFFENGGAARGAYIDLTATAAGAATNLLVSGGGGGGGGTTVSADLTTANVVELSSNLYFTNARVYSNVASMLATYTGNVSAGNLAVQGGSGGTIGGANLISTNVISALVWTGLYAANVAGLNTANVAETSSGLYYTNTRVHSNVLALLPTLAGNNIIIAANGQISANLSSVAASSVLATGVIGLNTANVSESTSNLYYTNTRVASNVIALLPTLAGDNITIAANGRISATASGGGGSVTSANLTTANVVEMASNLYFTNARVYSNVISLLQTYTGNINAGNLAIQGGSGGTIGGANVISSNVFSGNIWTGIYTANVIETASNLYFTNARVYANVIGLLNTKANVVDLTTANVTESVSNLYFTNARVYTNVLALLPTLAGDNITIAANGRISSTGGGGGGGITSASLTTANVIEIASNLYFTNARVAANVTNILPYYAGNLSAANVIVGTIYSNTLVGTGQGGYVTGANLISSNIFTGNVWNGIYTANVIETSGNLYFTNARVYANVIGLLNTKANVVDMTTANVAETSSGLYYTNARVYSNVIGLLNAKANVVDLTTANVIETASGLYYTNARVYSNVIGLLNAKANVVDLTTTNVAEGTQLYYTNARVRSTLSGGTGIGYDTTTGVISISQNVATTANVTFANLTVTGEAHFYGNVTTYSSNNLSISDNMIYLNSGAQSSNPDLGIAGNYNDGSYHHAGFFRDASDNGTWKVFENYSPEPDANIFIDTNHATFRLANLAATTFTGNVVGNVTGYVNSIDNFTTSNLVEGTQLYYTNARVYSNVISLLNAKANVVDLTTANVVETASGLYYTNTRVASNVLALLPTLAGDNITIAANGQISSSASGDVSSASLTTANVVELTNLYYTNARARSAFTAGANITIDVNGVISSSGGSGGSGSISGNAGSQLAITNSQVLTGGNKLYTLASATDTANSILVAINGIVQIPTVDYTLNGGQGLEFSANTPANAAIEVKFYGYSALNPNVAVVSSTVNFPTVAGQASYMMGANVTEEQSVIVALDGLIQRPVIDYTVNNTTITLIPAPPEGSNVEIRFFGQEAVALAGAQNTTAYISNSRTYAGGSANLDLGTNVALARNIIVNIDGVTQIPDVNYTVSGNTLSFGSSTPSTSSIVEVKFFGAEAFNANLTQAMVTAVLPTVLSNDTLVRQIIRSSAYAFSRIFY